MSPAIPGTSGYVSPSTYSRVRTLRRSVSIPGGLRITCIIGLGEAVETVILSAEGGAADGVNPDYAASNAPDGRHFELAKTALISQRTTILKNGIPLSGFEGTISTNAFDDRYDYRMEPLTGRVELQRAHLVDQGGSYYAAAGANVGNGTLSFLELIDANAPSETWTLRATSVIRDSYGDPVTDGAVFNVTGSVSGTVADAYGAPVVFISDGVTRDNGILRVAIAEGTTVFDRGDRFTIIVSSGVLVAGDLLEARYVATEDLNDAEWFTDANSLYQKHGYPSTTNTLSLGASMAFENGAFGILALQARPPMPRRTSEVLIAANDPLTTATEGLPGLQVPPTPSSSDVDLFNFSINNGVPDTDTEVNVFVIDADAGTETQVFPSKTAFYNSLITNDPYNNFIDNPNYTYGYTVILDGQVEDEGVDGIVTAGSYEFRAASASFAGSNLETGEADPTKHIRIFTMDRYGSSVTAIAGTYIIGSVGDGTGDDTVVSLDAVAPGASGTLPFASSGTDLCWELVDSADESARILFTTDLNTGGTMSRGDGIRVTYIDTEDADFYDNNWATALDTIEASTLQILVLLPDQNFSAIQQAGRTHVGLMSNTANRRERVLFTGAQTGVTAQALLGNELVAVEDIGVLEGIQGDSADEILNNSIEDLQDFSIATNFGTTFRVLYLFPDQIVRVVDGTRTYLDGFYMAAAAAGYMSGNADYSIPLTRKNLIGFSILRDRTYNQTTINSLGAAGVAVVVPVTGGGQVVHGKTTTASGASEEEELSVIFIRDFIATSMRQVMQSFIGVPEDPTLAAAIASKAISALSAFSAMNYITDWQNLGVSRDVTDPRQWNIIVEIAPNIPVGWVFIDVTVSVS
jgi:hypothetical protein